MKGGEKEMKKALGRGGQSTLEYVIVLTAIVAAILFAATQFIRPNVNAIYGQVGNRLNASATFFENKVGVHQNVV